MSTNYMLTVGLEIHAELKTRTKMFCDSRNDPDESRPNVNICPVCMGHPGTLPVINREAVKHILKVGLALGGTLADKTSFDRKNYFYPDIPKGYQLSQYEFPLVTGGTLCGIAITRVHLEEDTATSLHAPQRSDLKSGKRSDLDDSSLLDFNRAGVPLMELVTKPVIGSAKEAGDFARELQLLLRYLGASDANMEKGEMRVEANISVISKSQFPRLPIGGQAISKLGTKVEVKNLNSFRAVEHAILYEFERQTSLLRSGEKVLQETRGWDEAPGKTFSQRRKEESHDYRYFPDPDLPKLCISEIREFHPRYLLSAMPELPAARRARYEESGLKAEDAAILTGNRTLAALFDGAARELGGRSELALAASYLTSDLMGLLKKAPPSLPPSSEEGNERGDESFRFTPATFAELIRMVQKKKLSSRGAKDILAILFKKGGTPERIAGERGLIQKSDAGELAAVVNGIIAAHPKVAADYRGGKTAALQFLVGQGMKATRGAANPELLRKLFISRLK